MNVQEWLRATPRLFPDYINYVTDNTPYQNPVIAETQQETYENVENALYFLIHIALPTHSEKACVSLSEKSTWGYITLLECIAGAIAFELKYRPDGGEPVEKIKEEKEEQKVTFKLHQGKPYKKYCVFSKSPDGSVKYIGRMLAPNDELALKKAKENFGKTLKEGYSLFVAQRLGKH